MSEPDGGRALSFLRRPPPRGCQVRRLVIEAGRQGPYAPADWADALVIVEAGELEVECEQGSTARFAAGAVLFLASVPVRWLRSADGQPVTLTVLSRLKPAVALTRRDPQ